MIIMNMNYDEGVFIDYDNELIDILKNISEKNDSVYSFVLEKINYYNEELDEMNLVNIFDKTIKYLESPEDYFTKNDII